jgi:hypothetical protein
MHKTVVSGPREKGQNIHNENGTSLNRRRHHCGGGSIRIQGASRYYTVIAYIKKEVTPMKMPMYSVDPYNVLPQLCH